MKRLMRIIIFILPVLLLTGSVYAGTLSSLINGGQIIAGDKLFDSWEVDYYTSESGRTFNADNIEITPLIDGGLDPGPGLKFNALNGELSITGDGIYAYIDLAIKFRVSVLAPGLAIKDNSLTYSPGGAYWSVLLDDSYDVGSYIHESIGTAAGLDDLGTKAIEFSIFKLPTDDAVNTSIVFDSASFTPQSEIWVTKNLLVWAVDDTDGAGIFNFEQRFSQQSTVPEPSTLLLIGLGIVGTAAFYRIRPH
jgi:hypothetical protein